MTIETLIEALKAFPRTLEVRALSGKDNEIYPISIDNLLHTSETAFVNDDAHVDEWDCEDGKIELGSGKQYLLINAIIV